MKEILKKILRLMDVEPQEAVLVFLLLAQSVFLGIFYGAFDTSANSLFLGSFPAEKLPQAFTISGLAGILMTSLYSYFQSKIRFSILAMANLFLVALLTVLMWLGFNLTMSKWHVFIVLVMAGPLNIIAMLGFWGTAGRLFSLRQGKRLFGLVDAGQIIGVIISCYAIPVLLSFHFKTKDLLLISSVSVILALAFQIVTTFKNKVLGEKIEKSEDASPEIGLFHLLKNKFVRLMSAFVVLSMVAAFFVVYSFLGVTKTKYPDTNDFAKFFGAYMGTVMFFTLMVKLLVYGKFMKTYGLRASLVISPVLLVILTVVASLIGMIGGYTGNATGFIFFFIIISLSRLFSVTLKSAIEAPSLKVLYQTIDVRLRYHVQARVEGNVNELSALFSGLLLLVLGSLSFFSLINFSQVLVLILVAWSWTAYKLYKAYKNNLDESLISIKTSDSSGESKNETGIASLLSGDESAPKVLYVMNLQEKVQPIVYERLLPYLLHHKLPVVRHYALERSNYHRIFEVLDTLKDIHDKDLEEQSKKLSKALSDELALGFMTERIFTLARSKDYNDRILAARLVGESKNSEFVQVVKLLLRDLDNRVKVAAIKAAAKLKNGELAPVVAEFLSIDVFNRYSFDSLVEIGDDAIEFLENLFNKSGNETSLLLRIVRIIGSIGGTKAFNSLVNKVNFHNIEVARLSAKMLLAAKYKVDEEQSYLLNQALMQTMAISAWNFAARASLHEANADNLIKEAIEEEIQICFDHLFTLLSLAYDPKSISHIRHNIESESAESTGYAIELLELIVADDLKPILFPIIDDISDREKINQLQFHFPVDITPYHDLLIDIINRDFNCISKWTKACALNSFASFESLEITDDITAQLFNPDELLSELASYVINKFDPDKISKCFYRLDEKTRLRLRTNFENYKNAPEKLLINKILFLKKVQCFENIEGDKLFFLANLLTEKKYNDGDEIEGIDAEFSVYVYFLASGEVTASYGDKKESVIKPGNLFGGIFSQHYQLGLPGFTATGEVKLYEIKQEMFDTVVFDYPEFADNLILFEPIEI